MKYIEENQDNWKMNDEARAEAILELLGEYGEIAEDLQNKILMQKDTKVLQMWVKLAARAGSIQNFVQGMHEQN